MVLSAAWFEGGKNDPKLALLEFDADRAEIWLSNSSILAELNCLWGPTLRKITGTKLPKLISVSAGPELPTGKTAIIFACSCELSTLFRYGVTPTANGKQFALAAMDCPRSPPRRAAGKVDPRARQQLPAKQRPQPKGMLQVSY